MKLRQQRASPLAELGRYLSVIDWPCLFSGMDGCHGLLDTFCEVIRTVLDLIMPLKRVCVNMSDAPCMTDHLKSLIQKRKKAFSKNGAQSTQFGFYRKQSAGGKKWNAYKCEAQSNSGNLKNSIQIEELNDLSTQQSADVINAPQFRATRGVSSATPPPGLVVT